MVYDYLLLLSVYVLVSKHTLLWYVFRRARTIHLMTQISSVCCFFSHIFINLTICTYKVNQLKKIYGKVEYRRKITIAYHFNYWHDLYQYKFNTDFLIFSYNENNSNIIIYCNLVCIHIAELDPPDLFCEGSTCADHKLFYEKNLAYKALPDWKHTLESRTCINGLCFCSFKKSKKCSTRA